MAIQAKITTIQGLTLETAYVNIQSPQITKEKIEGINSYSIGGNTCIYASKATYDAGKIPVEGFSVVCELDLTQNPIEQLYVQLKLNERLSEMEDC
jgi:hypothetical protein